MSDGSDFEQRGRKPCPGCVGVRVPNMIPWFGSLCSQCTNLPARLYPYTPLAKDPRALRFPMPSSSAGEDVHGVPVVPFEPMSSDELRSLVAEMEKAEIDERVRFERHRERFAARRDPEPERAA